MSLSPDIDRGWAYVVFIGFFLERVLVPGMSTSPGILYGIMLDHFDESPALTAWAINLNSFVMYTSGIICTFVIKAFGLRVATVIGCAFAFFGLLVTSFAPNLLCVLFFYGIVTGFGFSMINISCFPVVAEYFSKYRGTVLLLGSSGIGVGQFVLPYLFFSLSNAYSWRGALIVMAGLYLNFLVVAAAFMPPRTQFYYETEEERLSFSALSLEQSLKSISIQSLMDCHSIYGSVITSSSVRGTLMTDLIVFQDYCFVLICFRYFFGALGIAGTMTQLKAFGTDKGLTDFEATTLLSSFGLFSLIGTVTMTVLLRCPRTNVFALNLIFSIGIGGATISFGLVKARTDFFIASAFFGFFCGSIASFPLVIMTVVGPQNIAAGITYASITLGIGCAVGGPIGAVLYTVDPTFVTTFTTLGIVDIFGALLQIPIIPARNFS